MSPEAHQPDDRAPSLAESLDRRTVLRAAGVGGVLAATGSVLAGCGGGSTPVTSGGSGSANTLKVPAASVPVGSGVIVEGTLVVQPTAGTFLAFDGTCPHQGCAVNKIANGLALCPCHGSTFSVVDGSVKHGPAQQGLAKRSATLTGDQVVIN